MNRMNKLTSSIYCIAFLLTLLAGGAGLAAPSPSVTERPATLVVSVTPQNPQPGEPVEITLKVVPTSGVKINRYPKIRFNVEQLDGVIDGGEVTHGNDAPPPPDKMDTNYYKTAEPLTLTLSVDASATPGLHEFEGQVRYFYCVAKSGFCAPKKDRVKIALNVR
jgi:hypothetical protein